jgi:cytosine deaminase
MSEVASRVEAASLRLRRASLAGGELVDIDCAGGRIVACEPTGANRPVGAACEVLDLAGMLVLPAFVEPHAHLDKAYTADILSNPTGDLAGAIAAWHGAAPAMTVSEIAGRARRAVRAYLDSGCVAVRTHVAVGPGIGLRAVEALVEVAHEVADLVELQVVAHVGHPLAPSGSRHATLLRDALAVGANLVGGSPHLSDDPIAETYACVEIAGEAGVGLDLHTDETLDPAMLTLEVLAKAVVASGFTGGVTASHCVSLGMQEGSVQRRVAEELAMAGIGVVTLPQTNLYLQARSVETAAPRALTALGALERAGVVVGAGGDNLQDPFNPLGRADPLEAASLLVSAGHLTVERAHHAVTAAPRRLLQLPEVEVQVGSPADLVAIGVRNLREALAEAPGERVVVRVGRVLVDNRRGDARGVAVDGEASWR